MEPFRVTCETCRSRLKVRSLEAVGQILACPKCGSMVLIAAPADWAVDSSVATSAAVNHTAQESLLSVSSTLSTIVPSEFNFDAPLEAAPATIAAPPLDASPEPAADLEPAAAGISPLVWCAIGGAAAFVVAGATYILWPNGSNAADKRANAVVAASPITPPTAAAPTDKPEASQAVTDAATPAAPPAANKTAPDAAQTPAAPANATATSPPATPPPVEVAQPAQKTEPTTPLSTSPPSAANTDPKATASNTDSKPATPPPTSVALAAPPAPAERPDQAARAGNKQVLKFDPLDFDPEHLSLSSTPATASASSIPTAPPADSTADAAPPKAPEVSDVLPPPAQNNQSINVRRGAATPDDARPLDTAQHLALKVKGLELTDIPIARFADTLSGITGAAITLDPIALELNGQSARTPVSMKVSDATLDKALQETLATQRLALVDQDGHVTISLANADERRAADFDVKDLVTDGDAGPVAKLIETFVAPHSWKSTGGKGTMEVQGGSLHIDQTLAVRREVLIFCERLRLARNRPLRSKYPTDLLTISNPYEKLASTLSKSTTFTFLPWTRLADVFSQWQQLTGITILVDWSAAADINLRPSSPVACSTIHRPWEEALDGTLEPLGLTWWAVDNQTIQITSLDAIDRIERVEFYTIPKKLREEAASDDALIDSLQKQVEGRPNKHGKSTASHIELDQLSGHLIVRATPDTQRFLATLIREQGN